LRLFSFGGYGLAIAALALVVFGAIECPLFSGTNQNEATRLGRSGSKYGGGCSLSGLPRENPFTFFLAQFFFLNQEKSFNTKAA